MIRVALAKNPVGNYVGCHAGVVYVAKPQWRARYGPNARVIGYEAYADGEGIGGGRLLADARHYINEHANREAAAS